MDDMLNGKQSRDHLQQLIGEADKRRLARSAKESKKKSSSVWRSWLAQITSVFTS